MYGQNAVFVFTEWVESTRCSGLELRDLWRTNNITRCAATVRLPLIRENKIVQIH